MKKTYITPASSVVALDGETLMNSLLIGSTGENSASEGLTNRNDYDDAGWDDFEEEEEL